MAKKSKKKTPKTREKTEEITILDDAEYKNMKYIFIVLLVGAIVFLAVYLIGFINILLYKIL